MFADDANAEVVRTSVYSKEADDGNASDVFHINFRDGRSDQLTRQQFQQIYEPLSQDPDVVGVYQVSDMSDRYWRPKLEEAQAALERFNGEHGSVISKYELYQNTIENNTPSQIAWQAEHEQEYRSLIGQRDALRDAVVNNPIVKRGRKQAQEQAIAARENYLDLASKAASGAERRDYKRAAKLQGDAAELFGAPSQYDKTEKNGFAQYMSDYGKGALNTFSDKDFWTRGLTQIARDIDLHGIRKKVEDAEKTKGAPLEEGDFDRILSDSEKAQLFSFYNLARAQAERANDLSSAYKAGTSAAESVGFMAEFLLSQGLANVAGKALSASANGLARWMGQALMSEKALNRAVAQGVTAIPQMSTAAKVGTELARPVVQGLWHTGTQLSTLSNIASMMNQTNGKGELNSVGRGIWLGFADSLVENWSESFGNTIDFGMEALGKGLGWTGNKVLGKTTFGQAARWALHSPFAQTLKEAGFNGFFGEMMEEWAGNAVRLATGLMDKDEFKQFASIEQQLEMAASFAPMSLFGLAGNVVSGAKNKKEYEKLSQKTKDIFLKNNIPQAEIDAIFKKKWATTEDIAAALAPYAQRVLNNEGSTAKADYKTILDFAKMAGADAFNEAVTEYQNEQRRGEMQEAIQAQIGRQFWTDSDVMDNKTGDVVRTESSVRVVTDSDGNSYFVTSVDETGVAGVSTVDGSTKILFNDQIASDNTSSLNDYLQSRVVASDKDTESKRMYNEFQQNLTAVRQRIAENPAFDMGTPEAPKVVTVVPESVSNEGLQVTYKEEGQDIITPMLTWKEVAAYLGMPFEPKTDAQLTDEAVAAQEEAQARKTKYNNIPVGTQINVTMPGAEGDEQVPYRFAKAIYDESEGSVRIYVADENGQIMTDSKGDEVWFPEEMVQGLDTVADQAIQQNNTPDPVESETPSSPEAIEAPVSRYTNDAGKVNQTAFMKNEPEEWAKWNDERRQDNGANSKERLAAAIGELDKEINDLNKKKAATANPDDADAIEEKVNGLAERHGRLKAIFDGYVAREKAAKEAEDAAKRAEFEAAAAKKKEAEKKAAAKIQDDLKEDASFVELAETYANQEKTYGDKDTYNVGGRKFKGRWVVAEATTPKPSHNPLNEFAPTPGYPIGKAGNSNHYDKDKRAQEITREMSNPFDERAVQEPVVVTKHGIVLSGNGRTQARLLAAQQQTDAEYKEYVREHASKWGLTAEQVDAYANPILYFELEEDVEYTAALFDAFNRSTSKQQSATETAAKVAQMTSEELVMRLDRLFREIGDSIDNLYKNPEKVNELLNMLQAAGIFNANERARYVDEYGNLSGAGEDLVESVLFGTIFDTSDDAVRSAMNDKAVRRAVTFAFPTLVRLRNLNGELSLIGELTEAVSLLSQAKAANNGKAENAVIDYMLQGNLWTGETPIVKATVQLLAHVLNDGKYGSLRAVLNQYIERAEAANYGQAIFTDEGTIEVETKERILRDVLAHNKINIEVYGNTAATQQGVSADDAVRPASGEQGSSGTGTDGAGETNPAGVQGERASAQEVAPEGPVDILEVAKEQAERIKRLKKRVAKWKKFLGDSFAIAEGIRDIEKIEDAGTRQQVLSRQQTAGDVEGWFDTKTGKAVIYLPNIPDEKTLDQKIIHEVLSHKGIRGMLGEERFAQLCDYVWGQMGEEDRSRYLNYPGVVGIEDLQARQRAAADEYLAHESERRAAIIAEQTIDADFWTKLGEFVKNFINDAVGEDLLMTAGELGEMLKDAANYVRRNSPAAPESEDTGALFSIANAFSKSREEFDAMQKLAEQKRGIVATGLYDVAFPIQGVPRHGFTGSGKQAIEKARKWAEDNLVGGHKYHEGQPDEFSYEITGGKNGSIGEMLSKLSTTHSDNLGVHLAVLRELPAVIDASYDVEIHADYTKENGHRTADSKVNPYTLIHRLYGAVNIDGQIYRVKTTIEEHRDKKNDAYTYQVTKVELLISGSAASDALSNSTISAANLLKGVEKSYDSGKKLLDAEYLDAVEAGDMETAQRIVDQAAQAAGYTVKAFHGSLSKDITRFDKDKIGSRYAYDERGFFFTSSPTIAGYYASSEFDSSRKGKVYPVFLGLQNPLVVDAKFARKEGLGRQFSDMDAIEVWDNYQSFLLDKVDEGGNDGVLINDGQTQMYVVFDANQIKSAEPVTRDDAGKVIPVSERFDSRSEDIRFSLRGAAEIDKPYETALRRGNLLAAKDMVRQAANAAMPNTVVRDKNGVIVPVYHDTNSKRYVNRETGQDWEDVDWKERMDWESRNDWNEHWEERGFYTFDRRNARTSIEMPAFFFAPQMDEYHEYGERTIQAYINLTNPAIDPDIENAGVTDNAGAEAMQRLIDQGYDGFIRTDEDGNVREYGVFDSSQIKSADAITKDDNGRVIPLSKRFDLSNSDIRFSVRNGYEDERSAYQGNGTWAAPGAPFDKEQFRDLDAMREAVEEGWDVNLWAIAQGVIPQPDDYFSANGPRFYAYNDKAGLETQKVIAAAMKKIQKGEDAIVKVYRAVPNDIREGSPRNGDWVSPSKTYAENHGLSRFGEGQFRIQEFDAPAQFLWWDGNDAREWGFDDGESYAYKNTPNNRKLTDEVTYDDNGQPIPAEKRYDKSNPDVRFSITPAVQREMNSIKAAAQADGTFMKAPNGKASDLSEELWLLVRTPNFLRYFGDWINDPASASKILDNNGEPAVVFHGSNWNPLDEQPGEAVFEDSFRGTGSGDNGFFGRGFYFTYQDGSYATAKQAKAEANYYGGNITEAFLNIRNPFMFNETLYQFNGKSNLGSEKESVAIVNMVKNFPELVKDYRVDVVDSEGNVSSEITLAEYAKIFEDTYNNKEFIIREGRDERDKNIVELCADPVHHEEVINGHKVEWGDYGFRMPMYRPGRNEDAQLAYTHYYLTYLNDMWREDHTGVAYNFPSHMFSELFESEEFTQALKDKGYDGVLQSATGDEAVAFQSEQIKSATAGNGEFTESKDIRFSIKDFNPIRADQTQTKAFKDWFKGSKVVDENGNPLVVYRGASFDPLAQEPGMGVIKPQRFFSPSEDYAKRYGLWTRAYFLNIQHPFDVRNKKDAAVLREFLPKGYQFHVGPTGALDWAELSAFDLDELIEAHPEYDGMVFDEGGDPDGNGGVTYRGVSYMPFNGGTQVKSATSNNGEYSQTNPDVRFSVKRYRDFTTAQQAQKLPGTEYPTDQQMVRFSLSNRNRTAVSAWLRKRKDLTDDQRKVVVDYLDELSNPKLQLATARWFAQGVIRLPEDMPKVEQAVAVADRAKVDPLQYDSPMELIEAHADIEIKEKPINPDTVPTLHKAKEYKDYGIVVYDVDDTEESRENMRSIINTHYGKEASPWCLLQGDGNGKLTDESAKYWRHYNGYQRQVAFKDGKLLAFSANDDQYVLWWDRQDAPHYGIPAGWLPIKGDALGRSVSYIYTEGGMLRPEEDSMLIKGNRQNGEYTEWWPNGNMSEHGFFKDGKRDGIYEEYNEKWGYLRSRINYKNGEREGLAEYFYENGEIRNRSYWENGWAIKAEQFYLGGNLEWVRNRNKFAEYDGYQASYNSDGSLAESYEMKAGKKHGKHEVYGSDGKLRLEENYKNGELDGAVTAWDVNGDIKSRENYEKGHRVDVNEYYDYGEGRISLRMTYDRHGVCRRSEGFHKNGTIANYKLYDEKGENHGVWKAWSSDGVLTYMVQHEHGDYVRNLLAEGVTEQEADAIRFSVVTDKAELERLEKEPTVTLYRAMELIDGELYPPMSQKVPNAKEEKGKKMQRREGVKPGMWQKSDEDPAKAYQKKKDGPWYYDLKKIDSKQSDTNGVLYNPYLHLSASPLNDQFSAASNRPNLVTVACEVPVSEFTSGYKAEKANDSVGPKDWHSGTVTAQLGEGRQVVLSRWAKIVRIVPDSEVASIMAPKLVAKNITVPANVVTPSLRAALEARGVKFAEPEGEDENVRFSVALAGVLNGISDAEVERALNSNLVKGWLKTKGEGQRYNLFDPGANFIRKFAKATLGIDNKYEVAGMFYNAAEELEDIIKYASANGLRESIVNKVDYKNGAALNEYIETGQPLYSDKELAEISDRIPEGMRQPFLDAVRAFTDEKRIRDEIQRIKTFDNGNAVTKAFILYDIATRRIREQYPGDERFFINRKGDRRFKNNNEDRFVLKSSVADGLLHRIATMPLDKIGNTSLVSDGTQEVRFSVGDNLPVQGRLFDMEGNVIRYQSEGGLPMQEGRTSYVERTYRKRGDFSFMGKDKIETAGDVAFIFKELETSAVENSFIVYVKKGVPTILHTGIGDIAHTTIDESAFVAGLNDFEPDTVYMVHNHPSGRVEASRADISMLEVLQRIAGNVPVKGVIIDTLSGRYGEFSYNSFPNTKVKDASKESEGRHPLEVKSFDKMVFRPEYRANMSKGLTNAKEVAAFLSAHRLGKGSKVGALLLNNAMNVVGNLVLNENEITNANAKELARQVVNAAVHSAANSAILFGDFGYNKMSVAVFRSELGSLSAQRIGLADVVRIEGNNTRSLADGTLADSASVRFSVRSSEEMDAEYMRSIEAGDLDAATRLVEEAARRAMPESAVVDEYYRPKVVLHGTRKQFTSFDPNKIGSANDAGWLGRGFYFYGNNPVYASQYANFNNKEGNGRVIHAFLNIENPYWASVEDFQRLADANSREASEQFTEMLKEEGYDGVYYNGDGNEEWMAFYPEQIKSAEPVTRDDNGNVIPLSERFNIKEKDIRFSVRAAEGVRSEGISAVVGRDNVGDFYMELYRALPSDMRKEAADRAMGNGLNIRSAMQDYMSEAAAKGEDSTGLLRMAETLLSDYAEGELDEATARYVLWRGGRGVNDNDLLDVAHDQFMRNRLGLGRRRLEESEPRSVQDDIQRAREEVDTNPSDAQKKAGNYAHGHLTLDGYEISIENPKGSVRSGKDANGKEWQVTMNSDYGYIRMTEGVDGDHIDIFLSDNPTQGNVFVVDQVNPDTGEFDEHKVMYGFADMQAAQEAYLANYSPGWKGLGRLTGVSKDEFKKWVNSSHRKTKPFSEYVSVKTEGDVRVENWAGDQLSETSGQLSDNSGQSGVRFSVGDEVKAADAAAEAAVDEANEAMKAGRKEIKDLLTMAKAMGLQKEYDKKTVEAVTNLAKQLLKDQYVDALSRREVSRLLGIVRTSVGRAPKTVKKNADAIVEMVIEHLLRREREGLKKITSVTGVRKNASGVSVQGELDVRGQNIMKAYNEGIKKGGFVVKDGIRQVDTSFLDSMIADLQDDLDNPNDAVRKAAEARSDGLELAKAYWEGVQKSNLDEQTVKEAVAKAKKDFEKGDLSKTILNDTIAQTETEIRNIHIESIMRHRELRAKIQQALSGSADAKKKFRDKEKQRVEHIHHLANADMEGVHTNKPGKDDAFVNGALPQTVLGPLYTHVQFFKLFGRKNPYGKGYLYEYYVRKWREAQDAEYVGMQRSMEILDAKVEEIFGEGKTFSDLFAISRSIDHENRKNGKVDTMKYLDSGVMTEHELTMGQLLYIYMVNKMSDGKMKLRRMGITEEQVEAIHEQLDERFVRFADWVQNEYLVELRNKYNAVHERVFGASMAGIDNYFPLRIDMRDVTREDDISKESNEIQLPSTITGSIINRTRNNKNLDITHTDALAVLFEHVQEMEHWASFAEYIKDVNTLLSYRRFQNQVTSMKTVFGTGDKLFQNFRTAMKISAGAYHPKVSDAETAVNSAARAVSTAKIALRLYTALKQFASISAFMPDVTLKNAAKVTASPIETWKWCMENLPSFAARWGLQNAGDEKLLPNDKEWKMLKKDFVKKLAEVGLTPNRFIDAVTVSLGARAIYLSKHDGYKQEGYTDEEADKRAKQDAEIAFNETQQSSENAFLSALQKDRTFVHQALTVFRNSSFGFTRRSVEAARNLRRMTKKGYKEDSVKFMTKQLIRDGLSEEQASVAAERRYNRALWYNLATLATNTFVNTFLWNLSSHIVYILFGDDDDKKLKYLIEDALHALFGGWAEGFALGNVFSDKVGNIVAGESPFRFSPSLTPIMSDIENLGRTLKSDPVAGVNDLVNLAVQAGLGVNPQTVTDAVVAVIDACNGDMDTSREAMFLILRIIQVPQSQLDELYIDELGMDGKRARKLSYTQLAKRYAEYKVNKKAPLTGWMYSDDERKKKRKSQENTFKRKVNERKDKQK